MQVLLSWWISTPAGGRLYVKLKSALSKVVSKSRLSKLDAPLATDLNKSQNLILTTMLRWRVFAKSTMGFFFSKGMLIQPYVAEVQYVIESLGSKKYFFFRVIYTISNSTCSSVCQRVNKWGNVMKSKITVKNNHKNIIIINF